MNETAARSRLVRFTSFMPISQRDVGRMVLNILGIKDEPMFRPVWEPQAGSDNLYIELGQDATAAPYFRFLGVEHQPHSCRSTYDPSRTGECTTIRHHFEWRPSDALTEEAFMGAITLVDKLLGQRRDYGSSRLC